MEKSNTRGKRLTPFTLRRLNCSNCSSPRTSLEGNSGCEAGTGWGEIRVSGQISAGCFLKALLSAFTVFKSSIERKTEMDWKR